jgi:hypothetical protein
LQALSTHDWPPGHWPGPVQAAAASAAVRQTPSFAQVPMRASIVSQYWSVVQVYLQKPPWHFFGVAAVPPHWASEVQFGVGRVSMTQAPWLQNWPVPHWASPVQPVPAPPPVVVPPSPPPLVVPTGFGSQTVLTQVKPTPQADAAQLVRHWPSAQTFPSAHSLENLHVSWTGVHAPATQVRPVPQSLTAVQGQGPAVPPQAWQVLAAVHVLPLPQSFVAVHSFRVTGAEPGGAQKPPWQVSPRAQDASAPHAVAQPPLVQTEPAGQLESPVQGVVLGALTVEQPYASHW